MSEHENDSFSSDSDFIKEKIKRDYYGLSNENEEVWSLRSLNLPDKELDRAFDIDLDFIDLNT